MDVPKLSNFTLFHSVPNQMILSVLLYGSNYCIIIMTLIIARSSS